jgi:hypothetical protein
MRPETFEIGPVSAALEQFRPEGFQYAVSREIAILTSKMADMAAEIRTLKETVANLREELSLQVEADDDRFDDVLDRLDDVENQVMGA